MNFYFFLSKGGATSADFTYITPDLITSISSSAFQYFSASLVNSWSTSYFTYLTSDQITALINSQYYSSFSSTVQAILSSLATNTAVKVNTVSASDGFVNKPLTCLSLIQIIFMWIVLN